MMHSFLSQEDDNGFGLNNIPFGVGKFQQEIFIATRIADYIINLSALENLKLLNTADKHIFSNQVSLNKFAAQGNEFVAGIRKQIQNLFHTNSELRNNAQLLKKILYPNTSIQLLLPFSIGGYTDFYASLHHATNVGKLFRPNDPPLLPNWKHIPVAYNGRASTVFVSNTPVYRPNGMIKLPHEDYPKFKASQKLDFECELGIFIGTGNQYNHPISVLDAKQHIFGVVLLNDWSARDIQAFEYQPLGPFLSKSFATSISPWVVTLDALQDAFSPLDVQDPVPAAYLDSRHANKLSIEIHVEIIPAGTDKKYLITKTNSDELYWSIEQMLAHHTINGCIMNSGDLLGSGTISGSDESSWGSMLELTFNGSNPLKLGEIERKFLENGDTVMISGFALDKYGYKINLGSVSATIYASE